MGYAVEVFAVVAALLADLLLGNYGCTPCLTVFVLFHASQCVSERFAAVLALLAGVTVDLLYCRHSAWTPVLFVAALFAGRAALLRRENGRNAVSMLLSGAVMGTVLALGEMISAGISGWNESLCRLSSGLLFGALGALLMLTALDLLRGYLGLANSSRPVKSQLSSEGQKRRVRQVRAANMGRRGR